MKTNAILSLSRAVVILAMSAIALIGIFSEPQGDSATWAEDFIISKLIGCVAAFIAVVSYASWSKTDKWIKAFHKFNMKGCEE